MSRSQKTSLDIDNENELYTTIVFKEQATDLATVRSMDEALDKFGYTKNDKINRRELVEIYKKVETSINQEVEKLSMKSNYKELKDKKMVFQQIHHDFASQQLQAVEKNHHKQNEHFALGTQYLHEKNKQNSVEKQQNLNQTIENRNNLNDLYKKIESNQLFSSLKSQKTPKIRYSNTLINLFHTEKNLNKLEQYDDAIKVRLKINEILPKETKKFYEKYNEKIEKQISNLEKKQMKDDRKLEENNINSIWKNKREEEENERILKQRIINNRRDMDHAHIMESKLKPEMSVRPSLLWEKRKNYNTTGSGLRGQQLLDNARNKETNSVVYAESLVSRHDFDEMLQNTMTIVNRK